MRLKEKLKYKLKYAIGNIYCILFPQEKQTIYSAIFSPHGLNFWRRQALYFIVSNETDSSTHWAGKPGDVFLSAGRHVLDDYENDTVYRRPMLDAFSVYVNEEEVTELGCGGGRNLEYLRRILNVPLRGIDINPTVIQNNKSLSNITYECRNIGTDNIRAEAVICCAFLMYLTRHKIAELFNQIKPALIGIAEPCVDPDAQSVEFNVLAYTHGYRQIFIELGYRPLFEYLANDRDHYIYHAVFQRVVK
jgi:SAM-dependent methyltransferase